MTQTRPRINDDTAAKVHAYADKLHVNFGTAVNVLLILGLKSPTAEKLIKGDGNDEND